MSESQPRNPFGAVLKAIAQQFRPVFALLSREWTRDDFTLWPPPTLAATDAQPPDASETAPAADLSTD